MALPDPKISGLNASSTAVEPDHPDIVSAQPGESDEAAEKRAETEGGGGRKRRRRSRRRRSSEEDVAATPQLGEEAQGPAPSRVVLRGRSGIFEQTLSSAKNSLDNDKLTN